MTESEAEAMAVWHVTVNSEEPSYVVTAPDATTACIAAAGAAGIAGGDDDVVLARLLGRSVAVLEPVAKMAEPKRLGEPFKMVTEEPLEMRVRSPAVDKVH